MDFYQALFTTNNPLILDNLENLIEPLITSNDNEMLTKLLASEEIFAILKKMATEKAPGPSGMTIFFFKFF